MVKPRLFAQLANLISPPTFIFQGVAQLAVLLQIRSLRIASLPEVPTLCVTVLIKAMGEVLAGHRYHHTLPVLKVSLVDVAQPIHNPT